MDYFCLLNDLLIGNALGAVKNDHLSAPFKAIFLKNMLYDLIIFVGIRPQIMAFFFAPGNAAVCHASLGSPACKAVNRKIFFPSLIQVPSIR